VPSAGPQMTATSVVSLTTARTSRPGRGLMLSLAFLSALVCGLAAVYVAHHTTGDAPDRAGLAVLVVGVPMATGLFALGSRSDARFGAILLATGYAWSLTALAESRSSLPYSTGRVAAWLVFPWLIYLLLAFPDGRIGPGLDRALFRALNGLLVVLFVGSALLVTRYPELTPWASCRLDCPPNAFMLPDAEPAAMRQLVQPARELLAVALLAGATASMARRWRVATPLRRRTVGAAMLGCAASVVLLAAFYAAREISSDGQPAAALGVLWALCIPAIAGAFFVGLLRRRLLIGQALLRLGTTLGAERDPRGMRDAVAAALRDPTLELLVPDGPARWRDSRGRTAAALPAAASGRHVTVIRDADAPALALVHDTQLVADEELVRAVGMLLLANLRNQRLQTRLAASLRQLETSRRRIAKVADLERVRIERDLHDGAQQRLIMLRIRVTLAEELLHSDPEAGAELVARLGAEVEQTLDELRALAHGVYPSMLRDRGLVAALAGLAAHAPVPVRVQGAAGPRHSTEIETAVYFACVEAVQNAIKHGRGATGVWIVMREDAGLNVEVRDDGPGFSPRDAESDGGSVVPGGLRNMHDRIEAVGGRLAIETAPGHGTRILIHVPRR
jgi:signal transduction histidine kinase